MDVGWTAMSFPRVRVTSESVTFMRGPRAHLGTSSCTANMINSYGDGYWEEERW